MARRGTIKQASESGDTRQQLEALRDRLAAQLDSPDTPPHAVAPLARQFQAAVLALAQLPAPAGENIVEQLRRQRVERLAAAGRGPNGELLAGGEVGG